MLRQALALIAFGLLRVSLGACTETDGPLLLRDPTVSRTELAFSYAGNIWVASRDGSHLRQLTSGGHDRKPRFSPDGSLIAFSADYVDDVFGRHQSGGIYVVSAAGGKLRRLTYHPLDLSVVGWTPDGSHVLFSSRRAAFELHLQTLLQVFSIPVEGGFAQQLPLPRAVEVALSPDGSQIAYVPNVRFQPEWKHYRGGQTTPIWVAKLADSSIEARIPRDNSNDSNPMWVGDSIYFLSDREGPTTLFAYNTRSQQVRKIVRNDGLDIKSAGACPDTIVYEQFGALHLLDLRTGENRALDLHPVGDFPETHPHLQKIELSQIRFAGLSPTGTEAVFGAHGEIFVAQTASGKARNLTQTSEAVERDPAWSPDGRSIAYFSDESGEYQLHIRDVGGRGIVQKIGLGDPAFYYTPTWSPDSRKIAYTDQRLHFWYVDLAERKPVLMDTDAYVDKPHALQTVWSPDSRWIAYTRQLPSHQHAVFLYSLDQGRSIQLTDGTSDALHVAFDKNGQYLYFTASTDVALSESSMDMTSLERPVTRSVYAVVLSKDTLSPLAPRASESVAPQDKAATRVRIDLEAIGQRIVRLPIEARNYCALIPGKPGVVFLIEGPQLSSLQREDTAVNVRRFDLRTLQMESILDDVVVFARNRKYIPSFHLSADGEKILYTSQGQWRTAPADLAAARRSHSLDLTGMQVYVEPRAEWRHMYDQAWRDERDFFYDPGLHGLDLDAAKDQYQPFVANIQTREDLSYLFGEMLANITVGHMAVWSGYVPKTEAETGLLGADYAVDGSRYRFARIYGGDTWKQEVRAPLTQPGATVLAGEYLLAVDGHDVHATQDVYSFFTHTAGHQVTLTVGPSPDGTSSRHVTVMPVQDETPLRNDAWVEDNRRKVDELSGGRIAYIYLADTAEQGLRSFNRDFFSQVGKAAAIVDERYNNGGAIADYMIDYLRRPLMYFWHLRFGEDIAEPQEAIFGPKVMLINEMAGSGGDALPWMFRKAGVGPLVGTRTWGGLVSGNLPDEFVDGGFVSAPTYAFYNPNGTWDVENHGVSPDVEIDEDPKATRNGHDLQLEAAVSTALNLLRENPPPVAHHPPYENYHQQDIRESSRLDASRWVGGQLLDTGHK